MKDDDALLVQDNVATVTDEALRKNILDLLERVPPALSKDDVERLDRLRERLFRAGRSLVSAYYHRSVLAEAITDIHDEEDWCLLVKGVEHVRDPLSGEVTERLVTFDTWAEFRPVLASALGISTGSIGNYIKMVKFAREVIGLAPGDFPHVGGIVTVGHMLDVTVGHDLRTGNLVQNVRPKTEKFRRELEKAYPDKRSYADMLRQYFWDNVAHDYEDPSAINRPPRELREQADDVLGRPTIDVFPTSDRMGFEIVASIPIGDGLASVEERVSLKFEKRPAQTVLEWVAERLGVRW